VILSEAGHEIPKQYLDCSKARRMLDWRPRYVLDDALRQTVTWYREFLNA
jgi:CDP-glucose 4,6-dehydratase